MNKTEMVVILKEQLVKLVEKYKHHIEKDDTKKAIETLRLIKETSGLIDMYDYKFMHSCYSTEDDNEIVKMVSFWEQNSDGDIRNNRSWEVVREIRQTIDLED